MSNAGPMDKTGGQNGQDAALDGTKPEDLFIRLMQKQLNVSRRIDAKMRKARAEREDNTKKWEEFQAKLRTSFIEQRQQYLSDSQKLDKEILDLQEQKATTIRHIQDLVEQKERIQPAPTGKATAAVPTEDDVAAWNELLAQTPRRLDVECEEDAVLREALHAAQDPEGFLNMTLQEIAAASGPISHTVVAQPKEMRGQNVAAAATAADMWTPPRRTTQVLPMTPPRPHSSTTQGVPAATCGGLSMAAIPAYMEATPAAQQDPYMNSPNISGIVNQAPMEGAPTFGPIRTPKQREKPKLSEPRLLQVGSGAITVPAADAKTDGLVDGSAPYVRTRIIDDDHSQESQGLIDLSMME